MHRISRYFVFVVCVVTLAGCILKPGRGLNKNKKFRSPLANAAVAKAGSADEIRQLLQQRTGRIDTVRANFELIAGGGIRGRQMINAMMFVQIPGFLRVRGSQNEGTLFDVLINRNAVQILSFPDKKFYRGTLDQLQQNPDLLAGIQPQDLMEYFAIEQTLINRLSTLQFPMDHADDHYVIRAQRPNGMIEVYYLRDRDLLVDQLERFYGEKMVSRIRYWAYDIYSNGYLLPTEFVIELPDDKGEFAVKVSSANVNEANSAELQRLQVPEGFDRMALGGN